MREYKVRLSGRVWVLTGPSAGGIEFGTLTEARRHIATLEGVQLGQGEYRDETLHYRIGDTE